MDAPWTGGSSPGGERHTVDGDHTIATPGGPPRFSFPFEGDSFDSPFKIFYYDFQDNQYDVLDAAGRIDAVANNRAGDFFILEQDFDVASDYFTPLAMNTPYDPSYAPDYSGSLDLSTAVLVAESPQLDAGNGTIKWVRTYVGMPWTLDALGVRYSCRNTFENCPVEFPGLAPQLVALGSGLSVLPVFLNFVTVSNGRQIIRREVQCRIQHDYFIAVDGSEVFQSFLSPGDVSFNFWKFAVFGDDTSVELDAVADPDFISKLSWQDPSGATQPAPYDFTTPPITDQNAGATVGYATALENHYEICVKASVIRPWRGNIYERITVWAIAQ